MARLVKVARLAREGALAKPPRRGLMWERGMEEGGPPATGPPGQVRGGGEVPGRTEVLRTLLEGDQELVGGPSTSTTTPTTQGSMVDRERLTPAHCAAARGHLGALCSLLTLLPHLVPINHSVCLNPF